MFEGIASRAYGRFRAQFSSQLAKRRPESGLGREVDGAVSFDIGAGGTREEKQRPDPPEASRCLARNDLPRPRIPLDLGTCFALAAARGCTAVLTVDILVDTKISLGTFFSCVYFRDAIRKFTEQFFVSIKHNHPGGSLG